MPGNVCGILIVKFPGTQKTQAHALRNLSVCPQKEDDSMRRSLDWHSKRRQNTS